MKRVYGITRIALTGVLQKPLRSFLTMLTAAIGIASVVATISITNGANSAVRSSLTNFGTNIIVVQNKSNIQNRIRRSSKAISLVRDLPGIGGIFKKQPLDFNDVRRLKEEYSDEGVLVSPAILKKLNASLDGDEKPKRRTIIGTEPNYFKMFPLDMKAGRLMTSEEIVRGDKVCVIDEALIYMMLPSNVGAEDVIGRTINVSQKRKKTAFRIVGVLKDPHLLRRRRKVKIDVGKIARGAHTSRLEFKNIYVPYYVLDNPRSPQMNAIFVMAQELDEVDALKEDVKTYMSGRNKDVLVWDQKTWIFSTLEILEELTSFSHYIWIMILAVAMIMIITITLVSVRERFYEIAIRITEGATKMRIMLQFAIESLYLSAAGGILGIGLGYVIIDILRYYFIHWEAPVSYRVILFAFFISVLFGILTSIPTAKRAASLNPVDVFRMH